jgi:hypothetical protein
MQIGQGPMLRFFKYFRRKVWRKYWRFLLKLLLVFAKIVIITLVFEKNANFFCRKLAQIAENYDHNIDPSSTLRRAPNLSLGCQDVMLRCQDCL